MIHKMIVRTKTRGNPTPFIGQLKRINGILYVLCHSMKGKDYLVHNGRPLTEWREVVEEETESHSDQKPDNG